MEYTFSTSGTTGPRKFFRMSEDLVQRRIEVSHRTKGNAFALITSLFCDLNPNSWSGFRAQRWAEANGIKFFNSTGGSIASAWALFEREQIEGIIGYPDALVRYASFNFSYRFKAVLVTGAGLMPKQSRLIRAGLGDDLSTSYGASEVGSISLGTAAQAEAIAGCVGKLCPDVEIDFDQGGFLKVKTSTMIEGYEDPILTEKHFKEGWFISGDRGHMQDDLLILDPR
jgi:long-subunit acyl-CoA synthetase (AMP-forming)